MKVTYKQQLNTLQQFTENVQIPLESKGKQTEGQTEDYWYTYLSISIHDPATAWLRRQYTQQGEFYSGMSESALVSKNSCHVKLFATVASIK